MLQILHKLRQWWAPPPELIAGPRRIKNYSAQTGFQYQYRLESSLPGDYRFLIWTTAHPVTPVRITVPLPHLAARDRYALAKLALFRNFDEHAPGTLPAHIEVADTAALDELTRSQTV